MKNITEIREELFNSKVQSLSNFISFYSNDERKGVKQLVKTAQIRLLDYENELKRVTQMSKFEREFSENGYICGVDEVGRGPLAGPVVAAAVIFPKDFVVPYVNDSKKLTESKREELYNLIICEAITFGIGSVDNEEIDKINILQATFKAMRQAISSLKVRPDIILVDGNKTIPELPIEQKAIVKGDSKSFSIAAASIVAKVLRDRYMKEMDTVYPMYDFKSNKGYPSSKHKKGIKDFGLSPLHRKTYIHL